MCYLLHTGCELQHNTEYHIAADIVHIQIIFLSKMHSYASWFLPIRVTVFFHELKQCVQIVVCFESVTELFMYVIISLLQE